MIKPGQIYKYKSCLSKTSLNFHIGDSPCSANISTEDLIFLVLKIEETQKPVSNGSGYYNKIWVLIKDKVYWNFLNKNNSQLLHFFELIR